MAPPTEFIDGFLSACYQRPAQSDGQNFLRNIMAVDFCAYRWARRRGCSPQVDTAVSYGCRSETNIAAVSLPVGDSPTSAAMYVQEASASAVMHNLLQFRCRIMHPPMSRAVRNFVLWDCNSIQKYRRDLRLGSAAGIPKNHS